MLGKALLAGTLAVGAVAGTVTATTGSAHAMPMWHRCAIVEGYGVYAAHMYETTTGAEQRMWLREIMDNNRWVSANC
jgi:hypothetical protein